MPYPIDLIYVWCGKPETKYCKFNLDLTYSVKSVRKFMPWIRHIWVVVDDQFPMSESKSMPRNIKLVRESEFIPKKYLPITWNSNVPESWIWRIPGLSEHFIYSCDDMYVGKPINPSDFFVGERPITRLCPGPPDYPAKTNSPIPYVQMWSNAVDKYNLNYTRIQHQILPYRKSHMEQFYKKYKKQVDAASNNKIRAGALDFNLLRFTSALAPMSGQGFVLVTNEPYDYFTECDDLKRVKKILKVRPTFFCINNNSIDNKHVTKMLDKYFA